MVLSYFAKYTHRTTHVETHKRWLDGRNCKELQDWPDAGLHDCLFGAVLRGMSHAQLDTTEHTIQSIRAEAMKGAATIFENNDHRFHKDLADILTEHVAPDKPEDSPFENDFEFWKSEMV